MRSECTKHLLRIEEQEWVNYRVLIVTQFHLFEEFSMTVIHISKFKFTVLKHVDLLLYG